MIALRLSSFSLVFIFLTCIFECLATPDVGITQDSVLNEKKLISFSAFLHFNADANNNNPVDALTDKQLMGLVKKAWREMQTHYQALPADDKHGGGTLLLHLLSWY